MPEVSVVMGAKDAQATIADCLNSVLASTYKDFDVVVVDDGSTDATKEIVGAIMERDRRVRMIVQPYNMGLAAALNLGISRSDSRYICRIDADDMAWPDRLAAQVAFLDRKRDIGVLGSGLVKIGPEGTPKGYVAPNCASPLIPWQVNWGVPFAHPTVMLRRETLEQAGVTYDESLMAAQDYDLWTRLLPSCNGANQFRPWIWYRVHPGQVTARKKHHTLNPNKLFARQLERVLGEPPDPVDVVSQIKVFSAQDAPDCDTLTFRDAVQFRQEVCRLLARNDPPKAKVYKAGFGLDLLRLMRFPSIRGHASWIMSDGFRRTSVVHGFPFAACEVAIRRYWRIRGLAYADQPVQPVITRRAY